MLALLTLTWGCGAGAPLAPEPPETLSLTAGRYFLRIFTLPTRHTVNGTSTMVFVCLGINMSADGASIGLPVDVAPNGARWTGRAAGGGTLALQLDATRGGLAGTIEGQAAVDDWVVTIGDRPDAASSAFVTATAGPSSFSGDIQGPVLFSRGGGSQSCSDNGWSLTPQ